MEYHQEIAMTAARIPKDPLQNVFDRLKAVSVGTRLVEETDPESGSSYLVILTKKKSDITWEEYDRVVHDILENVCSDYTIAEDYSK
jgi:hypothetical protein